ncbi:MAG TPA: NAD(P)(+) transhydrogenase (Re/Si-specific) subunit beta [Vicinamibacterales bacterium]|jgi:NAD(P) transhydrogenase subunit beta|nr:NAD(P)(+) transhydrogenase (Re/Si-specific) subunit beta [Vicinamibacterales bacterium]
MNTATELLYLVAAALFILALRWMSRPETARRAVGAAVAGMLLAVGGTLLNPEIVTYKWIAIAAVAGTLLGVPLARVPLTAVPERTGLSQAFGGLAAGLVGTAKYYLWLSEGQLTHFRMAVVAGEVILGCLTCTGGLLAAGKLAEWMTTRPITYRGQNVVSFLLLAVAASLGVWLTIDPTQSWAFPIVIALALVFGVLLILPIGGADMPTVISFLNSYAGLSAVAMGFVLENKLLIAAGALDGSSGFVLSIIMCRAMNRSVTNVLFGAFGSVQAAAQKTEQRTVKSATATDAAELLANADRVVVIPGYGMAVAQAQHRVRDLHDQLTKRGVDVRFAVHPVAGRMPGHMNVLLAEADIPYDRLVEMDDINPEMPQVGVALVIGANDVVNPAARTDERSPIYGMPIIDADKAQTVLAIKRSMNPGFAGIENELYYAPNTLMLFGDAKQVIGDVVKELSGETSAH